MSGNKSQCGIIQGYGVILMINTEENDIMDIFGHKKSTAKYWHLPIFTGRRQPTIFGTTGLNFRVRYGNGWTPCVIDTN